jgi:hypothetical protein
MYLRVCCWYLDLSRRTRETFWKTCTMKNFIIYSPYQIIHMGAMRNPHKVFSGSPKRSDILTDQGVDSRTILMRLKNRIWWGEVVICGISGSHGGWDIAQCNLAAVYWRFGGAYRLHYQSDDGGTTYFWNVGLLQRDYTALYPRKLSSGLGQTPVAVPS